jgi:ribulose 1,5-bisphosphate synthetase/thiazole synthase
VARCGRHCGDHHRKEFWIYYPEGDLWLHSAAMVEIYQSAMSAALHAVTHVRSTNQQTASAVCTDVLVEESAASAVEPAVVESRLVVDEAGHAAREHFRYG